MRPDVPRPRKRAARAAARLQIRARLGWLRGFPVAGALEEWRVMPGAGREASHVIRVDRETIRRSAHAVRSLRRRFPRALPDVVGDVDAWFASIEERLDIVKSVVHLGAPWPDARGLLARSALPTGLGHRLLALAWGPLADAAAPLVWMHWNDAPALEAVVDWLESCPSLAPAVSRLPAERRLQFVLQACELGPEAPEAHRTLTAWLEDDDVWRTPLRPGEVLPAVLERLRRLSMKRRRKEESVDPPVWSRPESNVAERVVHEYLRIHAVPPRDRERRMRILVALLPTGVVASWQAWWTRAEQLFHEARRLLEWGERDEDLRDEVVELLERHIDVAPPAESLPFRDFSDAVVAARPALAEAVLRVLETLPEVVGSSPPRCPRRTFAVTFDELMVSLRPSYLEGLCRGLADVLAAPGVDPATEPRLGWIAGPLLTEIRGTDRLGRWVPPFVTPLFETVTALLRAPKWEGDGPLDDLGLPIALRLLREGYAPGDVATFLLALDRTELETWYFREVLDVAVPLCGGDPRLFMKHVKVLDGWDDDDDNALAALTRLVEDPRRREIFSALLADGDVDLVRRFAALCSLAGSNVYRPVLESSPDPAGPAIDPSRLPEALHDAARRLHAVEPGAVERVLRREFPTPDRLRREIAGLEARVDDDPRLLPRLENLRTRLETAPRLPSPARAARLRERLERRGRRALVRLWHHEVTERIAGEERVAAVWIASDPSMSTALADLEPAQRRLAARLLEARRGEPPWDLREHEPNATWLRRLGESGVNVAPWLDGIGTRELAARDGMSIRLELESDPLEVLRMGHHFKTCLSPGKFNFFSAVTNAADVNKRVLYARDSRGRVLGRCLLAITETRGLLTFHAYAHRKELGFADLARSFVLELTEAMGIPAVAGGRVAKLVATDWYDDGPVDLTGSRAFLEEGSPFRASLPGLPAEALIETLRRETGASESTPDVALAVFFEPLLELPEIKARPELVLSLARELPLAEVGGYERMQLARLLRTAGADDEARRILLGLTLADLWRHGVWDSVAREFVELGLPHRALGVLRRFAGRGGWEGATDWQALVVVDALIALHRPRKAARLCRARLARLAEGSREHAAFARRLECVSR